ncbi:hypothetical protein BT93_L0655 [Corymbia citriodora subsp. variegata]|uniref:Protein kinase domain-containing protein n=1 Tax=Corymbia citriodora subsp. variegata TaxID=360336 RepID=A0A8T0CU96_CORYI|nr:hypothetical protein BT93_L0655 [Corymbia citriodora subsp. variegata]
MPKDQLLFHLLLLLFLLHHSFSTGFENNQCARSCGKIKNISSPFRLKGDPKSCGDPKYELACIKNHTILNLNSSKYYVQNIDYTNYTIRVADIHMTKGNCLPLSFRSLSCGNFSNDDPYSCIRYGYELYGYGLYKYKLYDFYGQGLIKTVSIVNCTKAIASRFSIDASSCLDRVEFSNFSSTGRKLYAMIDANASIVETTCILELTTMIPGWIDGNNLLSYAQIHEHMVYGFELSWLPIAVEIHCKHYYEWDISGKYRYRCRFKKVGFLVLKFILGAPWVMILLIHKWMGRHLAMDQNVEEFLQSNNNFLPIRYSYYDIKKITSHLKDKLGEGGYGSVYKGRLRSGREVAVKILKKGKSNGEDFISKVVTIGRIHHVNVVELIGFCFDGSKQALVYDFMHNGSLDKHIFSRGEGTSLYCKEVYEIALGVARGIEYLHQGCNMQILHFDIKPHNILLDRAFIPKVSDFGLARLYPMDYNTVSLTAARKTLGYMAPELVFKNLGGTSYKADVYSFGKLLMEMATGRKNADKVIEYSSHTYFPFWVHDQLSEGLDIPVGEASEEDRRIIKKMIIVALWCIQLNPSERPSMHKVLQMLEGEVDDLQIPPKPLFCPTEMSTKDDGSWSDNGRDTISTSLTGEMTYEDYHFEYTSTSITKV